MSIFNFTPAPSISNTHNFKYCKKCNQTLSITNFYKDNFYCITCCKINNALSKNKQTIKEAILFWEKHRTSKVYSEMNLFDPISEYYNWMMPFFFATISKKQWHLYLYAFFLTIHNDKEKANLALLSQSTISSSEEARIKRLTTDNLIFPDKIFDLSIPYITNFYKKRGRRLSVYTAAFVYTKICTNCNEYKFTHTDNNPGSLFSLLTSGKEIKLSPYQFIRDYNKRDGWALICTHCKAAESTNLMFKKNKSFYEELDDPKYDTLAPAREEREEVGESQGGATSAFAKFFSPPS